jgi:hypothetical protein
VEGREGKILSNKNNQKIKVIMGRGKEKHLLKLLPTL